MKQIFRILILLFCLLIVFIENIIYFATFGFINLTFGGKLGKFFIEKFGRLKNCY